MCKKFYTIYDIGSRCPSSPIDMILTNLLSEVVDIFHLLLLAVFE